IRLASSGGEVGIFGPPLASRAFWTPGRINAAKIPTMDRTTRLSTRARLVIDAASHARMTEISIVAECDSLQHRTSRRNHLLDDWVRASGASTIVARHL